MQTAAVTTIAPAARRMSARDSRAYWLGNFSLNQLGKIEMAKRLLSGRDHMYGTDAPLDPANDGERAMQHAGGGTWELPVRPSALAKVGRADLVDSLVSGIESWQRDRPALARHLALHEAPALATIDGAMASLRELAVAAADGRSGPYWSGTGRVPMEPPHSRKLTKAEVGQQLLKIASTAFEAGRQLDPQAAALAVARRDGHWPAR